MDLSRFMNSIAPFAQTHTGVTIALALGLLFFVYRKPKLFFSLLFLALFLAGVVYMITSVGRSSSIQKRRLIREEKEQSSLLESPSHGYRVPQISSFGDVR